MSSKEKNCVVALYEFQEKSNKIEESYCVMRFVQIYLHLNFILTYINKKKSENKDVNKAKYRQMKKCCVVTLYKFYEKSNKIRESTLCGPLCY